MNLNFCENIDINYEYEYTFLKNILEKYILYFKE